MEEENNSAKEIYEEPDFSIPEIDDSDEAFDAAINSSIKDDALDDSIESESEPKSKRHIPIDGDLADSKEEPESTKSTPSEPEEPRQILIEEAEDPVEKPEPKKIPIEEPEEPEEAEAPESREPKKISVEEVEDEEEPEVKEPTAEEKFESHLKSHESSASHAEEPIQSKPSLKKHTGLIVLLAIILIIGLTVAGVAIVSLLMQNGIINVNF